MPGETLRTVPTPGEPVMRGPDASVLRPVAPADVDAEGDVRELAVTALRTSALAAQAWGAAPTAFPGLP
ncbi:hypothetical protein [Aeromicrobium fastidiosum]|uniref:hypothetical protein n=1 Tax=Aeromicrobium fastidiosum TaxID=52699 RepID=UPI0020234027|nr:hypothetical protein [Aeromicrobium fastidiosum]